MELANGKTNQLVWKTTQNRYHVKNHDIEMDNPNVSFSILAQRVDEKATVLDIACGEGRWGDVLRKKNCILYGVDIDSSAIDCALQGGAYTHIWKCNIEDIDINSAEYIDLLNMKDSIDVIGLLDILEHTINPTKVIQNIVPIINVGKKILVSVPNIGHADIFLNLINGNFNYQEMGILDNTHTKYFTRRSFLQWIKEINDSNLGFKLECSYIGGTFSSTQYLDSIAEKYPDLFAVIQQNKEFNVIQLLFELTKKGSDDDTPVLNCELENDPCLDILSFLEQGVLDKESVIPILRANSLSWNEREFYKNRIKLLFEENTTLNRQKSLIEEQLTYAQRQWKDNKDGWEAAEAQLKKYTELLDVKEAQLQEAVDEWKRNANGWKDADNQIHELLNQSEKNEEQLKQAAEEWERNAAGWKESDEKLQTILKYQEEKEEQLKQAVEEWERNAVGWKESDEKLQTVLKYQEEKEEQLKQAVEEWERNAAGWKACDQQLQSALGLLEDKDFELDKQKSNNAKLNCELDKIKKSKWWPLLAKSLR